MKKIASIIVASAILVCAQVCFAESKTVHMVINSRNFTDRYTEDKLQIKAITDKEVPTADNAEVTAYVRVN